MAAGGGARWAAVLLPLVLAACAEVVLRGGSDLERTWSRAVVVVPPEDDQALLYTTMDDAALDRRLAARAPSRRWPVVLYLHGCTGIGNRAFLAALASAGFAVIAPDSMARKFRPLQCNPRDKTGGFNLYVYEFRLSEIAYALDRMRALDWVDRRNLFLIGTSEGGVATALYRGAEFQGRVIAQWTCNGAPIVRGIAAPPGEPILAMVRADDPWYDPARTQGQRGHCGEFMGARPGSDSIVLARKAGHNVFEDPANVRTILSFLERNRRP